MMPRTASQGERKALVLLLARDRGPITTSDLCRTFDLSKSYARDVLRTLADRDRLERDEGGFDPRRGRRDNLYTLAPRGEEYLSWYREQHGALPDLPR